MSVKQDKQILVLASLRHDGGQRLGALRTRGNKHTGIRAKDIAPAALGHLGAKLRHVLTYHSAAAALGQTAILPHFMQRKPHGRNDVSRG